MLASGLSAFFFFVQRRRPHASDVEQEIGVLWVVVEVLGEGREESRRERSGFFGERRGSSGEFREF